MENYKANLLLSEAKQSPVRFSSGDSAAFSLLSKRFSSKVGRLTEWLFSHGKENHFF